MTTKEPPITPLNSLFEGGPLFIDPQSRIKVRFVPVGNTPALREKKFAIIQSNGSKPFSNLTVHVKRALCAEKSLEQHEPIYLYLTQSFIPDDDCLLADLNEHFGIDNELTVTYSKIPQWG